MKKYKFKDLDNINNFILRILQLLIDTVKMNVKTVVKKIENYGSNWNSKYCNVLLNPDCTLLYYGSEILSSEELGDTGKIKFTIKEKQKEYCINIYYSKDNWRPLYDIQLFDSDHLLMAKFSNENLNNPRYLHELPTLEQEVAYDIYATYCNYNETKELTDYQHLEIYPKYVEKSFSDSTLLKDIIKHLQQLDSPQMFINYCKTVLTK